MGANEDVDVKIVEDPTEETGVMTELNIEDAAGEEESEDVENVTEVAEDTGLKLEADDTGDWFGSLHLDKEPAS